MDQPPYGTPVCPPDLATGVPTRDERTWAMLCHVLALPGLLFMFGHVVVPLVVWLVKRESSPFVDDQGRESVNFQITATIAMFVAGLTIPLMIGFLLFPAVVIGWLVYTIIGTLRANEGIAYRYPFSLRLIK